jgi:hypothetical protein
MRIRRAWYSTVRTAELTAIFRQRRVYGEIRGLRHADQQAPGNAIVQVGVVFDALEVFLFGALILADERVVAAAKRVA